MNQHLSELKEEYIRSIEEDDSDSLDEFLSGFLSRSWEYNSQNMEKIRTVFADYERGDIPEDNFSASFKEMNLCLREKLRELDPGKNYPLLHSKEGVSLVVSLVDGLVLQYYIGLYDIEELNNRTSNLKNVLLHALKAEY